MELDATLLFISLVIGGVTEAIRLSVKAVNGAVTIGVAALVGLLIALVDVQLGLPNITPAAGIAAGLGMAGVVGTFRGKSSNTGTGYQH